MILQRLKKIGLIGCPEWLVDNTHYLVIMGSVAYGVSSDTSDNDVYGFAIPNKEIIFPHLRGEIFGFGTQHERFENWQQHHINDEETKKQYDFQVFSIVKFFQLCMQNNPNMIDSLFVPQRCILHSTSIGNIVRENRKIFLHKGCWHRFKGYAFSSLKKIKTKKINEFFNFCKTKNISTNITLNDIENEIQQRRNKKKNS